jgi:hypothetical protein
MSPERSLSERVLAKMSPVEIEEVLAATLFFYQTAVIRTGIAGLGKTSDPKTYQKFAQLPLDSMLRRSPVESISEFIITHPRRSELYPILEDGQITVICKQLYEAYSEQESIDVANRPDRIPKVNPFEFAVTAADFAFRINAVMHGAVPSLVTALTPQDSFTVIMTIATALQSNVRGLIPAETQR